MRLMNTKKRGIKKTDAERKIWRRTASWCDTNIKNQVEKRILKLTDSMALSKR